MRVVCGCLPLPKHMARRWLAGGFGWLWAALTPEVWAAFREVSVMQVLSYDAIELGQ